MVRYVDILMGPCSERTMNQARLLAARIHTLKTTLEHVARARAITIRVRHLVLRKASAPIVEKTRGSVLGQGTYPPKVLSCLVGDHQYRRALTGFLRVAALTIQLWLCTFKLGLKQSISSLSDGRKMPR